MSRSSTQRKRQMPETASVPMRRLDGRVALITGTSGGQGRAAALRFAEEGAIVVGCGRNVETAAQTVALVAAAGYEMHSTAPVDLGDSSEVNAWIEEAATRFGGIDILYNNAAAFAFSPISEMSDEDWHSTIRNELDLVFYACRAAWPYLKRSAHASIINVASVTGMVAFRPGMGTGAHAATKGAVIGLTRELANEGGPDGIRVNTLTPGYIRVPFRSELFDEMTPMFLSKQMLQRVGQPQDIAGVAAFLASDDSSFMTGSNVVVDGGVTAGD